MSRLLTRIASNRYSMKAKFRNKILIVDDDDATIKLLEEVLSTSGFETTKASNGISALEKIRKEQPDLILMDWNMPVMDGINTLIEINSDEKTKNIPVIMLTGIMTDPLNLKLAFDNGAFDFIKKSFNIVELKARINSALIIVNTNKQLINQKNNELTENALKIAKLNHFKNQCLNYINDLIKIHTNPEQSLEKLNEFKTLIQSSSVINNWQQFDQHFAQIHPDFYRKLSILHSQLSPSELKICALLKLNLNTKEIADILYLTPKTIKTMRSRIRKKLDLSSDEGLVTYLIKI